MHTTTLTDATGRHLRLDPSQLDGLVDLLAAGYPDAVASLAAGSIDQATARRAGAVLYQAPVSVVDRNGTAQLVARDSGPCDPVVAFCARLAERIGADDLAADARRHLLGQATESVRAGTGRHRAQVQEWASYLLTADGPIAVSSTAAVD